MYLNDTEAEIYDLLYQDRKDYAAEAALVTALIRERRADAASLLDVACGTGIHLAAFAKHFAQVAGLDYAAPMAARAEQRLSGVPVHIGDMRSFELDTKFDAVVCMFSSIGYLETVDDLRAAVATMGRHLTDGGVLVIEPWYFPDTFLPGYLSAHALNNGDAAITRMSHSTREGDRTRMDLHYLVGDRETGVQHRQEVDYLTLFSRADYESAYRAAGLSVHYFNQGNGTPGFFVGVRD